MQNDVLNLTKRCADEFSIAMSTDNNYLPYLGVTVRSLIEHANQTLNYTVYVLHSDIPSYSEERFRALETASVKIRFINIQAYLKDLDLKEFYLIDHFAIANYFRFFIPLIFSRFEQVLYCDCDAVFLDDAAKVLQEPLDSYLLAAVRDFYVASGSVLQENYWRGTLKLKNISEYFNSGFLIFNIGEAKRFGLTQKCLKRLGEIKTPRFVDQSVLNSICQGRVKFLSGDWNVQNAYQYSAVWADRLPYEIGLEYRQGLLHPKYLHFNGAVKPWRNPTLPNADYFFKYARLTPFYEQIIYRAAREPVPPTNKTWLEKIFSIKKCRVSALVAYKIVTIFGLEFRIRVRSLPLHP